MLVGFAKLIANISRHAWFNAPGAQTNQEQSDREHRPLSDGNSPRSRHARERQVAQAINNGERQNRPIFAEPTVCQNRPENRKEIVAELEIMRVSVRIVGS